MLFAIFCFLLILAIACIIIRLLFKGVKVRLYNITEDLSGKVVIVTGSNSGIGKETARELVRHGARVYLACRNVKAAHEVAEEIKETTGKQNIFVLALDLSSLASVRNFVVAFESKEQRLDILVNNAGLARVYDLHQMTLTDDGIETTMQTNHFGHFLLTNLLLPLLKKSAPSRIVNVASNFHALANFDIDNTPTFQASRYSAMNAYHCSKLCNILFTRALARRIYGTGVTTNVLHPGYVSTEIGRDFPGVHLLRWFCENILTAVILKTKFEGAQTSLYCALSPRLNHVSGHYFFNCKPEKPHLKALDDELAEKLWKISAQLTHLEE